MSIVLVDVVVLVDYVNIDGVFEDDVVVLYDIAVVEVIVEDVAGFLLYHY